MNGQPTLRIPACVFRALGTGRDRRNYGPTSTDAMLERSGRVLDQSRMVHRHCLYAWWRENHPIITTTMVSSSIAARASRIARIPSSIGPLTSTSRAALNSLKKSWSALPENCSGQSLSRYDILWLLLKMMWVTPVASVSAIERSGSLDLNLIPHLLGK